MRKIKKWLSFFTALCVCTFGFTSCSYVEDFLGNLGGESSSSSSLDDNSTEGNEGDSTQAGGNGENGNTGGNGAGDNEGNGGTGEGNIPDGGETGGGNDGEGGSSGGGNVEDIVTDDLSIHFLYFGNLTSGDSTLIKVGDTEVLIDAGSTNGSAEITVPYIQQYCTDGILEYVIATHAHADHISAFYGDGGIFDSFECKTIIDYTGKEKSIQLTDNYEAARDAEVAAGAKHYTALQCWNNVDGAQRSYTLGENVTLNILYQAGYEQGDGKDNNSYSVCTLLSQGDNHYLFTGDLEKKGEESLVASNTLPKCKVYKGGHHGSNTSSSMALLNVIQPEIVCVCSCCGDRYAFPHQEFIDNVANFTDKVYITTYKDITDNKAKPLNGNIVVTATKESVTVNGTNNNILFKDTDWFKANRTTPDAWKQA